MALTNHLRGFPDLPPIWLLGALGLSWGLGRLHFFPRPEGAQAVGGVLIALGLGLIAWAGLWFLRKRTPIEPHHDPRALIVEGPFRLSRNPIYLALVVIAAGIVLRQPSMLAILSVPLLWAVLDRRFARPEEARLREAFGAQAHDFVARTRRWL
jgi:protein-S-isoprenylcysteine O-methyltransferase Ste14